MDSTGKETKYQIQRDAIMAAIDKGTLTRKVMSERLHHLVDVEISKNDPDMKLIKLWEDLLWELNSTSEYINDSELSKRALIEKLDRQDESWQRRSFSFHKAIVVAVTTVVIVCIGIYGGSQWLSGESTVDEQQYVIHGQSVDPGIVLKGNADEAIRKNGEIWTSNLDEITNFLGYTPKQLNSIPACMQTEELYASILSSFDTYAVMYVNDNGEYIKYSVVRYADIASAAHRFEQDGSGKEYKIGNQIVYYSNNYGDNFFVWFDELDCFSLNGTLSTKEMLDVIESSIN